MGLRTATGTAPQLRCIVCLAVAVLPNAHTMQFRTAASFRHRRKPLSGLRSTWFKENGKSAFFAGFRKGPARLGDLRRLFPAASKKMLTQHLRQMERDRLIVRSDLSGRVPHVQYSLLESRGIAISRLLDFLATWGAEYPPEIGRIFIRYSKG